MEPTGKVLGFRVEDNKVNGISGLGFRVWIGIQIKVPFEVPSIVRHPCRKDPTRDPNLENYAYKPYTI